MAVERAALHAYLSLEAHTAWQDYAEENGISVTGLLEALGQELIADMEKTGDATEVRQPWVKAARKIDAHRRRRG